MRSHRFEKNSTPIDTQWEQSYPYFLPLFPFFFFFLAKEQSGNTSQAPCLVRYWLLERVNFVHFSEIEIINWA